MKGPGRPAPAASAESAAAWGIARLRSDGLPGIAAVKSIKAFELVEKRSLGVRRAEREMDAWHALHAAKSCSRQDGDAGVAGKSWKPWHCEGR